MGNSETLDVIVYNWIFSGKQRLSTVWSAIRNTKSIDTVYAYRDIDKSLQRLRKGRKIVFDSKTGWRVRVSLPMTPETKVQVDSGEHCHSDSDGDCNWKDCPQIRDNEPEQGGRHCPLDRRLKDEE